MAEPRFVVALPTPELAFSLSQRFSEIPGEQGVAIDYDEGYFAVELVEFPRKPADLDHLLELVRSWLREAGLENVTVETRWPVRRPSGKSRARRVLTWKFEEGPADAAEGSDRDLGPAWLDTIYEIGPTESEPIRGGEWIPRGEARRLASENGYDFSEDD
jgi:hypothetical protein